MNHEMQMRNAMNQMPEWQIGCYIEDFDIPSLTQQYGHATDVCDMARMIDLFECVNKDQAMVLAILVWDYKNKQD